MNRDQDIYKIIKTLLIEICEIDSELIKINSSLDKDLSIFGQDATELMQAYFNIFNIKGINNFNYYDYFVPESFDPLGLILLVRKLFFPSTVPRLVHDLTVEDLVKIAKFGTWYNPYDKTGPQG